MSETITLRIDGQATIRGGSLLGQRVQDETIDIEPGTELVSDGPVAIEIVPDDE